jgi:flagellar basal-body rod protein FlgC
MDIGSISDIASSGMAMEKRRVELASLKLAMANTAYSSAAEAKMAANTLASHNFAALIGDGRGPQNNAAVEIKSVQDPGHPSADTAGLVYYLKIDPIHEMATLVSALRSYEANVRAYNTNSEMNKSALSIGGN